MIYILHMVYMIALITVCDKPCVPQQHHQLHLDGNEATLLPEITDQTPACADNPVLETLLCFAFYIIHRIVYILNQSRCSAQQQI